MAENGGELMHLIGTLSIEPGAADLREHPGDRFPRAPRQPPSDGQELRQIRRSPKAWISAKKFIATQSRKGNFQTSPSPAARYKKGVQAIHARLIERAYSFKKPGLYFFRGQQQFVMI